DFMENVLWAQYLESPIFWPEPYCNTANKLKTSVHIIADGLYGGCNNGRPWRHGRSLGPRARVDSRAAVHDAGLRRLRRRRLLDPREPRELDAAPAHRVPGYDGRHALLRDARERAAPLLRLHARSLLQLAILRVPEGQVLLQRREPDVVGGRHERPARPVEQACPKHGLERRAAERCFRRMGDAQHHLGLQEP